MFTSQVGSIMDKKVKGAKGKFYVDYDKDNDYDKRKYFNTEKEALTFVEKRNANGDRCGYRDIKDDEGAEWLVEWMNWEGESKIQKKLFTDEMEAKKFLKTLPDEKYHKSMVCQ